MTNLSENENVRNWKDLSEVDRNAALRSNEIFASLQNIFPEADFSERDELLKKYEINLTCNYCEAIFSANFLLGIPKTCPTCKRNSLDIPLSPGAVADWMLKHYQIATTKNKDQNIYIYDKATGTWSDEKTDAVIKSELGIIFAENLTSQKFNNVRLALQAKTFLNAELFSAAIKRKDKQIFINVKNGVLCVDTETDKITILAKAPEFYFLGQLNVDYNPKASLPHKFLDFISEISLPNEENFISLLESWGYPLLPGYPIQRAIAMIGAGQNGKSTYLAAMEMFFGEHYVSHLSMQQLSNAAENSPFALTQLLGKLLNIADDLPARPLKDVGVFKQLLGGSSLEAERKFGARISFRNTAKFIFAANQMPAVSEDTIAFYRRFLFIEFSNMIEKPRDQKEILSEIMSEEEKSGLLNILLYFIVPKLIKHNDFTYAKSVDIIAEQYQKHSNTAKLFLEKMLEYDPVGTIRKEDLWDAYQHFCGEKGLVMVSQKAFWSTFKEEFTQVVEQQYQENGIHKRNIKGIAFKELEEELKDSIQKISLEDYFDQYNQDNQDFSIFYIEFKKYINNKEIRKKAGNIGNTGINSDVQQLNSNNLLENQTKQPDSNNILEKSTTPASPETIAQAILRLLRKASQGLYLSGSAGWDLLYNTFPAYPQKEIDKVMQQLIFAGDIYEFKPGQFKSVSSFEAE